MFSPDLVSRIVGLAGDLPTRRTHRTVTSGDPCYIHANRNVAIIDAFRDAFRLSFFNAALMSDLDGLLEKQAPNTRHPDLIRFATNDRPAALDGAIARYLTEAKALAAEGRRPPKSTGATER